MCAIRADASPIGLLRLLRRGGSGGRSTAVAMEASGKASLAATASLFDIGPGVTAVLSVIGTIVRPGAGWLLGGKYW